jgi:hypothetical protein
VNKKRKRINLSSLFWSFLPVILFWSADGFLLLLVVGGQVFQQHHNNTTAAGF